jgi:predicted acyl esterase
MNAISYLLQRRLNLPPPLTRDVVVHRDLRVPMYDGVELLANRWAPRTGEPHASAKTLKPAGQAVYHDPGHPSAVILPFRQPTTIDLPRLSADLR